MRTRRARAEDLAAIVRIYNHAIENTTTTFDTEPFDVAARRAWFEQFDAEHPLFVAVPDDDDHEVLGFAHYTAYRPKPGYATTKETTIYVAPDASRRGVGSALYSVLIAHATNQGVHTLIAVLAGDNPASVALHRKHGFEPVGRLREVGRKHGAWIDTELWQRRLP